MKNQPIQAILLPTSEASDLILIGDWKKLVNNTSGILPKDLSKDESFQFLYLCIEGEIKKGDWILHSSHGVSNIYLCEKIVGKSISIEKGTSSCWIDYSK